MFFQLSKILNFILSPLTWIVVLMVLGLVTKNRWRIRFQWGSLILLLLFTNPFLAHTVMQAWEVNPYNQNALSKPFEVGVLLGGSLKYYDSETERPVYSHSVDRLMQTILLYKSGKIKKILLSGGSGQLLTPGERESDILLPVLLQSGIPKEDILMEKDSRNTYENAVYSAKALHQNCSDCSVLLITSGFHMRRSVACFEKVGIHVTPYPVDPKSKKIRLTPERTILPDIESLGFWDILIHEWFGFISYKIAGYV